MSVQAYGSYRDSGVGWLGNIPDHWPVIQSRRLFSQRKERSQEGDRQLTASQKYGILYQEDFMRLEDQRVMQVLHGADILKHVEPDDFVISMRSFEGGIEYSQIKGCISSAYVMLVPGEDLICAYFKWLFKSATYIQALQATSNLVRDGQALRFENFSLVPLPLPQIEEQAAIAAFLDRETLKIDALVEEQRQLVDLLKEKRQAVISRAVTKGLDPSVAMNDSGVEWLGEVPAHWDVFALKRDLAFLTSGSRGWADYYADDGALFVRIGNLTRDRIDLDLTDIQRVEVPKGAEGERTRIAPGDVLFSITAFLGSVAVVHEGIETAYVSQHVALARPTGRYLLPAWIGYVTLSWLGKTQLELGGYGGTKIQLSLGDVGELLMTAPPVAEQAEIVADLEAQLKRLSLLSTEAQSAIALLQERRSALISAAVTGKIDVRGLVPRTSEAA